MEAIAEDRALALASARDPHLEGKETAPSGPNPSRVHRIQKWGRRFVSLLNTWAHTPVVPTTLAAPVPGIRQMSPPTTILARSATSIHVATPAVPNMRRVPSPTTESTNVAVPTAPDTTIPARSTTPTTDAAIPAVPDIRRVPSPFTVPARSYAACSDSEICYLGQRVMSASSARTRFRDPKSKHLVVIIMISHASLVSFNLPQVTKVCILHAAASRLSRSPMSNLTSHVLS